MFLFKMAKNYRLLLLSVLLWFRKRGKMMPWKYYLVVVKCGHVRRSQYILKAFPIRAFDGKDAARIARNKARVKHDDKYAIVSVNELSKEQYDIEKKKFSEDNYHKVHSIQEQRMLCPNIYLEVLKEEQKETHKKTNVRRHLVDAQLVKEMNTLRYVDDYE